METAHAVPTLSIVMPVFNREDEVKEMILSIQANTFADWELLCIDDGSDAPCVTLLNELSAADPRIHYILRQRLPKGAPTCRNIGLEAARGKYIIFFDSDDYITPECLATRVETMEQHPDNDFMIAPSMVLTDGRFVYDKGSFMFGYPIFAADDVSHFCRRILPFVVCNNIYRLDSLRKAGITWDEALKSMQDADFNLTALTAGLRYAYIPCPPDYAYRINSTGAITQKMYTAEHNRSFLHAIEKFYALTVNYDRRSLSALFEGVILLYNRVSFQSANHDFARGAIDIIRRYDTCHARRFATIMWLTRLLEHIVSKKRARQLPVLRYILKNKRIVRHKGEAISAILQRATSLPEYHPLTSHQ